MKTTVVITILAALVLALALDDDAPDVECSRPHVQETVDVSAPTVTEPDRLDLRLLYDALRQVETGGHRDPANAVGDGGRSLGPYQIGKAHHADSLEHDQNLRGIRYEQVRDARTAERVMLAYWNRYVPGADWTYESLARTHNGGPKGRFRASTDGYWRKVSRAMGN